MNFENAFEAYVMYFFHNVLLVEFEFIALRSIIVSVVEFPSDLTALRISTYLDCNLAISPCVTIFCDLIKKNAYETFFVNFY